MQGACSGILPIIRCAALTKVDPPIRNAPLAALPHGEVLDCLSQAGIAFLTTPVEEAIATVMANLGERTGVDRVWMIEYDSERTSFRNSHEWCARSITSHLEDLQDTPVSMIAWLHRQLLQGRAVMIDDVAALPASARMLRREMLRQSDKSVLSVPIFHGGQLRGIIGYDTVRAACVWSDEDAAILHACARMLAEARYGMHQGREPVSQAHRNAPLVYVGSGGAMRGVALAQIAGIRSQRNNSRVWLNDGACLVDHRSLSAWRALLPRAKFPSVHRTAIVGLRHVAQLDKHGGTGFHWQVRIRGVAQDWPVSRAYRRELVERLGL